MICQCLRRHRGGQLHTGSRSRGESRFLPRVTQRFVGQRSEKIQCRDTVLLEEEVECQTYWAHHYGKGRGYQYSLWHLLAHDFLIEIRNEVPKILFDESYITQSVIPNISN